MITIAHGNVFDYWDCYWCFLNLFGDLISKAGVFWLVFDISLNLMRPGKAWNYISITNNKIADSAFKGNWKLQMAAKLLLIIIGETIYYIT
jgi:hypothetical protein